MTEKKRDIYFYSGPYLCTYLSWGFTIAICQKCGPNDPGTDKFVWFYMDNFDRDVVYRTECECGIRFKIITKYESVLGINRVKIEFLENGETGYFYHFNEGNTRFLNYEDINK